MEAALNSSLGRTILGPDTLRIGRAADNTLVLQDQQASAHHTEIAPGFGGNSHQISDLGSTNGTFVNELRLIPNNPRVLHHGDVIRIGSTNLTYEMSGAGTAYAPTVAANAPGYTPTVAAGSPGYTPTVAASAPNFDSSVVSSDPFAQTVAQTTPPAFQQPDAYGSYAASSQPSYTPPPVYPQPGYPQTQAAYPPPQGYPQPGYSQPGGFGQSSMPAPKKRTGLIVAIVVILVLIVGGGGAFFYIQSLPSPQKTLQAFCTALKAGDYQTVYNQYSSNVQNHITEAQFASFLRLGLDLQGGVTQCTVSNVAQDSSTTAHGTITITLGDNKTSSGTSPLVLENGAWKINTNGSNTI